MGKTTQGRPEDAREASLTPDDDATVVAKLVDAINRAITAPRDSQLKTDALHFRHETHTQTMRRVRKIAYHEAGHAVVARNFGLTVMRVSINRTHDELFEGKPQEGYMWLDRYAKRHATLHQRLWIALSGPAAQERNDPDAFQLDDLVCSRADYEYARGLYARIRGDPECKIEDLASDERRVSTLITRHWSAIEAVALALLEHPRHSLDRKELDALLLAQLR